MALNRSALNVPDIAVVATYLSTVVALGLFAFFRARSKRRSRQTAASYFLADRSLSWPIVGTALFATNISCVHLVSLAQSGYDSGLLIGNFEWMAALTLVVLAVLFAPVYLRARAATLPDFLEMRYDRACRDWLAVVSIFSAIIIHIGFAFLTGGKVIALLFPQLGGIYPAIAIVAALTGTYTVLGGLLSVVVTEVLQTIVLLLGATLITLVAYHRIGGWHDFTSALSSLGASQKLSMLRPHGDPSGMPWYAIMLGYPVLGIWYWCADQTIVQRVLGARDENHARAGALFCGLLKVFPVFIFVLPGLFAFVLASTGKLDISSLEGGGTGALVTDSRAIYSVMITQLLPRGLRGLVLAALLAALMSSVAGAVNSISTLASYDLYKRFAPDTSERRLVTVGRLAGVLALVLSICLVPLLDLYGSLFAGMNDIIAHIAPPITCVFLLGVIWKRANAYSARWTLWVGSSLGALVFLFNKLVPNSPLHTIPFMMMAFYLFMACIVLQVTLTLLSSSKDSNAGAGLVWKSPLSAVMENGWLGLADYRLLSVLLILLYIGLYTAFG